MSKSYRDFLNEKFVTLVGNDPRKHDYKHEVFGMLQKSYAHIGGIHGNGFKDADDMVKNIPMWKMHKKGGKITSLKMYKDTGGRKSVAMATNGEGSGKGSAATIMHDDVTRGRAWSEVSSSALKFGKRKLAERGVDIKDHAIHKDHVKKFFASKGEAVRDVPHDDPDAKAHPDLAHHMYQREIGGTWHTKLAIGKMGNKIR